MNKKEMETVLSKVKYKDWTFHVEERLLLGLNNGYSSEHIMQHPRAFYLQVRFPDADLMTGEIEIQHGRKWILSEHMKKSEIVTTAFKAVVTAEEHEIREKFRYRGRMIFGPHIDVDALHEACKQTDLRDDPKTVAVD